MKPVWKWILIGLGAFLLAFLLALPIFTGMCSRLTGGTFGWGMMNGGYSMMGFGFFMIAAVFLASVLLIVLAVAAVVWFQRTNRNNGGDSTAAINCPHCGKAIQKDWVVCPFCGVKK